MHPSPKNIWLTRSPGLLLAGIGSLAIMWVSNLPQVTKTGLSSLTLAIVMGMIIGNTLFSKVGAQCGPGVDFSRSTLLRLGVILYGFRITFLQIASVGWHGALLDIFMIALTFGLTLVVGIYWLKMDKETVILIGAGSSICGAAAVLATEPVVRSHAHKVSVAVATVVVFGTLSMFLYPLLYPYLGFNEGAYGLYVGSTIHEVAQVVAAAKAVSDQAASNAVIEKMLRVMMLSPFLILLSLGMSRHTRHHHEDGAHEGQHKPKVVIPWFAVWFIVASGFNSLDWIPKAALQVLLQFDLFLLTTAMFALGLRTSAGSIKQAGVKPLILAGVLFLFLTTGGYWLNRLVGAA
ncbi:MAG: YeiH family putative sulfate export transporter [Ferrovum sp.]|nr:YeiH family putative sulfate export transporter [Ferrovum sp.]NDU87141.1 YeiH family putative sulfate export transporter [Ferrovum sp.]